MKKIEIMDTTLRDGEQTSGVSFAAQEKVSIVRLLLEELKVDRVEIASARVSEGEFRSVQKMASWLRHMVISTVWRCLASWMAAPPSNGSPMQAVRW